MDIGGLQAKWGINDAGKLGDQMGISGTVLSGRNVNCPNLAFGWQFG
jgi:hypothetical protein